MQPQQFSLYGAVDLGARQSAAQRRQQQAERSGDDQPMATAVFETTDDTFADDVVERSRSVPVIVDLWAEWCGPCKQLSPVLEKLATEANGQWVLAKVDVDASPQLSAALRVQSIPMVVAVIGGQLVDGFLGALPEAQVREWLGQVLATAEQLGVRAGGRQADDAAAGGGPNGPDGPGGPGGQAQGGQPGAVSSQAGPQAQMPPPGPGGPPEHPGYEAAQQAMQRGDLEGAASAFQQTLAETPGDPVAKLGLAQVELIRRVNSYDQAQVRREAAAHPEDVAAQSRVADLDLATGKIDEAFDRMLGTVRRTSGEQRDQARRHLLSLFEIFPPRDPRVTKARSTLSSLLF